MLLKPSVAKVEDANNEVSVTGSGPHSCLALAENPLFCPPPLPPFLGLFSVVQSILKHPGFVPFFMQRLGNSTPRAPPRPKPPHQPLCLLTCDCIACLLLFPRFPAAAANCDCRPIDRKKTLVHGLRIHRRHRQQRPLNKAHRWKPDTVSIPLL